MQRFSSLQRLDGGNILPQARSALLHHGSRAPVAILLLHGFTNHPGQFREFAPVLHARGANVLVPRLPRHGYRDRLTTRTSSLTGQEMLERASAALDVACGLGDRVCVAGISSGGLLAAWFGQFRHDVARSVAVAPAFALLDLPHAVSSAAAVLARALPDAYLWWDPRVKDAMHPASAYPRFSTHALAQALLIGDDVWRASKTVPFRAGSVTLLLNAADPAVSNRAASIVAGRWARLRGGAGCTVLRDLPRNHDIIEPDNPHARTAEVYPVLVEEILKVPAS